MARRPRGPSITPDQERQLLALVKVGQYPAQAAKKLGLSKSAISMRKSRNSKFRQAIEAAEAYLEFALVAEVAKAAQRDWRAAMAILERRFPKRWARPEVRVQMSMRSSASADAAAVSAEDLKAWQEMVAMIPGRVPTSVALPNAPSGGGRS
jgi:hypothetical protein